jgi:hypothetical protein
LRAGLNLKASVRTVQRKLNQNNELAYLKMKEKRMFLWKIRRDLSFLLRPTAIGLMSGKMLFSLTRNRSILMDRMVGVTTGTTLENKCFFSTRKFGGGSVNLWVGLSHDRKTAPAEFSQ